MRTTILSTIVIGLFLVISVDGFLTLTSSSRVLLKQSIISVPVRALQNAHTKQRSGVSLGSMIDSSSESMQKELDVEAILKYITAGSIQMSLISLVFYGVDNLLSTLTSWTTLPAPLTWMISYALSLKSRVFNPLNNARPNRQKAIEGKESAGFRDRKMPTWTPPGPVFPIVWLLIIAPLRATSSTIIVQSLGSYFTLPLMSLMLHLSFGDIWNTINNTERRYGTSVLGIAAVYVSAVYASWQYYQINPLAGKLLGATVIWLTIASSLIFRTWQINPDECGSMESLLPLKKVGKKSITSFSWGKRK